jgi:hypothetical protein
VSNRADSCGGILRAVSAERPFERDTTVVVADPDSRQNGGYRVPGYLVGSHAS